MVDSALEREIIAQLRQLPEDQQQQVLEFARALVLPRPRGVPGKELLRFAGAIDPEDLKTMAQVIDEACEKVDPDEW